MRYQSLALNMGNKPMRSRYHGYRPTKPAKAKRREMETVEWVPDYDNVSFSARPNLETVMAQPPVIGLESTAFPLLSDRKRKEKGKASRDRIPPRIRDESYRPLDRIHEDGHPDVARFTTEELKVFHDYLTKSAESGRSTKPSPEGEYHGKYQVRHHYPFKAGL